jgi:hypothetical protein
VTFLLVTVDECWRAVSAADLQPPLLAARENPPRLQGPDSSATRRAGGPNAAAEFRRVPEYLFYPVGERWVKLAVCDISLSVIEIVSTFT